MHKCVLVNTVLTQIDKCLTVILWILIIFNLFFLVRTVIPTAAQVMDLGHALFSLQLHMHLLSLLWCLTPMSHAEALELKYKTYQFVPQVSFYKTYTL